MRMVQLPLPGAGIGALVKSCGATEVPAACALVCSRAAQRLHQLLAERDGEALLGGGHPYLDICLRLGVAAAIALFENRQQDPALERESDSSALVGIADPAFAAVGALTPAQNDFGNVECGPVAAVVTTMQSQFQVLAETGGKSVEHMDRTPQ